MTRRMCLAIVLIFSIAFAIDALPALGQGASPEEASRLIINVYLDGTGKALVTGYAENPDRLSFLNSSQYSYENETGQLYALTNSLTRKDGDVWTILFESPGYYEDYRVTFYLPTDFTVKNASSSNGLEHLFSASNDSLALDFQGYDVLDPVAIIEYQQPLDAAPPRYPPPPFLIPLSLALIFAVAAAAALLWRYKVRRSREPPIYPGEAHGPVLSEENIVQPDEALSSPSASKPIAPSVDGGLLSEDDATFIGTHPETATGAAVDTASEKESPPLAQSDQPHEDGRYFEADVFDGDGLEAGEEVDEKADWMGHEVGDEIIEANEDPDAEDAAAKADIPPLSSHAEKIEISSEMSAVMETLTPRERAVLQALIDRGGRSTQADLRYETRTPKSSLTGIIYSLERRKLITKKEWGRTNVIELSEWFLSKKGRS